ncbi:MAG TPA: hypothetical protein VF395_14670 [Polyangiaceae bacterium]
MLRPPTLAFLALLVPPTLSVGGRAPLESKAHSIGARLGNVFAVLAVTTSPSPADAADLPDIVSSAGAAPESDLLAEDTSLSAPSAGKPKSKTARGHGGHTVKPGHGVLIGASTVLRLANHGVIPVGRPVNAIGARPAGIELSSVSSLGVGMQDGDVLTEIAGQSVRSEGQVVGAVLGLRARKAAAISAVFYRGQERWSLVVEMPYPRGS